MEFCPGVAPAAVALLWEAHRYTCTGHIFPLSLGSQWGNAERAPAAVPLPSSSGAQSLEFSRAVWLPRTSSGECPKSSGGQGYN